jgi:hypothetical protein
MTAITARARLSCWQVPVPVRASLHRLFAGTTEWLTRNLEFFSPFADIPGLPPQRRVKAVLELALLCHCAARRNAADTYLSEAAAFLGMLWRRPDFLDLLAVPDPHYGRLYPLIYAALAPRGSSAELRATALARLAKHSQMPTPGQSAYLRAETRYYADKAGMAHGVESYEIMLGHGLLGEPATGLPITDQDIYALAHAIFYISDFGFHDPPLPASSREKSVRRVSHLTTQYAANGSWDLTAELVIAQFCLGGDPLNSPSGVAGILSLADAQSANGALPGRSAARRARDSASAATRFQRQYHTTLVAALMSVIVSAAAWCRPAASCSRDCLKEDG